MKEDEKKCKQSEIFPEFHLLNWTCLIQSNHIYIWFYFDIGVYRERY